MQEVESTSHTTLNRVLSPVGVMLLTFAALSPVVSFYIAGNGVLKIAGTGAALAFIVGGTASAILALLYAEIGSAFPRAGGTYAGLVALLGHMLSFPYILLQAPIFFASLAFTALGLGDYLRVLFPALPLVPTTIAGLIAAALIAIANIRFGTVVTAIFMVIQAVALAVLTWVAVAHPAHSLGEVVAHPVMLDHGKLVAVPIAVMALATVSGVWTTAGANWALYFGEEMRDVHKRIGRVVAWTGALAALLIAAPMVFLVMGMRDIPAILNAETPIAAYLSATAGPVVVTVVSVGVVAAIFNSVIANIMAYGRFFYSTGRDGVWPGPISKALGTLHSRWRSPVTATVLVTAVAALCTLLGEKTLLIFISGNVSDYLLVSIAVFVGRRNGRLGRDFRIPLHPVVPVFGLTFTVFAIIADLFDADAGRPSIILLIALFLGAMAYYHFRLRKVSKSWLVADDAPAEAAAE